MPSDDRHRAAKDRQAFRRPSPPPPPTYRNPCRWSTNKVYMYTFERARGDRPSFLMGLVAGLLVIGLTAALMVIDYNGKVRRATDQLDVAGQSLVETMHATLRSLESTLHRSEPTTEGGAHDERLASILALPYVEEVGHTSRDADPISWTGAVAVDESIGAELAAEIEAQPGQHVVYKGVGSDLLMAHPQEEGGRRAWDVALIDVSDLVATALPDSLEEDVAWEFEALPEGTELQVPDSSVHREYLILDSSTTWQFELRWTDATLAEMGVHFEWLGVVAGGLVAVFVGLLASRWVRRRYLEADLQATRELVEQKDLLLLAVSHQLRTPLTGTIGFLHLALDEPEDEMSEEQRDEFTHLALDQAEIASELVDDLLLATRMQDETLVTISDRVDVVPLIDAVFEATRGPGETLVYEDDDGSPTVTADPLRTRQLFRNLFGSGREQGARNWELETFEMKDSVVVSLRLDVVLDPEVGRLSADVVAVPEGLSGIRSRLDVARGLARLMGGQLDLHHQDGVTEIRVSLKPAEVAENQSASLEA